MSVSPPPRGRSPWLSPPQSGLNRAEATRNEICSPSSPRSAEPTATTALVNGTSLRSLIKSLMKSHKQRAQD